jgi:hypothetical protein
MAKDKRINVSGTVTPALHEFLEEFRWSNRLTKSDVVNAALVEWAKAKGFEEPTNGETPATEDAAPAEDAKAPAKATAKRAS